MAKPPLRTDEPVDRYFSRPVASVVVKILAPTPITPNGVTGLVALSGIVIGAALVLHEGVIAAIFCGVYLVLDCTDGQLARLRGGGGYLGRAMDGFGDYIAAIAIHIGLAVWLCALVPWPQAWLATIAAGASMSWGSFLLDRYKRRYSGDTDDLDAVRKEADETPGIKGWMVSTLLPYAIRLDGGMRVVDRPAYQERMRLPMRLWLLGGPTMHFTAMAVCFALGDPLLYVQIAIGPLNILTLLTLVFQVRLERQPPPVVEPVPATEA